MIDPTFRFTVTVYRKCISQKDGRNVTEWHKSIYRDCFFGMTAIRQLNGNVLSMADEYVCRIPFTGKKLELSPGDVIVKGAVSDTVSDKQGERIGDLLNKYKSESFTVRSVSDNTLLAYAPHCRASGV